MDAWMLIIVGVGMMQMLQLVAIGWLGWQVRKNGNGRVGKLWELVVGPAGDLSKPRIVTQHQMTSTDNAILLLREEFKRGLAERDKQLEERDKRFNTVCKFLVKEAKMPMLPFLVVDD